MLRNHAFPNNTNIVCGISVGNLLFQMNNHSCQYCTHHGRFGEECIFLAGEPLREPPKRNSIFYAFFCTRYILVRSTIHQGCVVIFIYIIVQWLSSVWLFVTPWTARLLCPSLSPGICSNSCPLSWWCHPTSSSSGHPTKLNSLMLGPYLAHLLFMKPKSAWLELVCSIHSISLR